jgi:hypothetical protein
MPELADHAPETEANKSRGLGSYVVWGFVVVIVYVLSSGPMMRYQFRHPWQTIPFEVCRIYSPLIVAYRSKPFHKPIGIYWHLWNIEAELGSYKEFVPEPAEY